MLLKSFSGVAIPTKKEAAVVVSSSRKITPPRAALSSGKGSVSRFVEKTAGRAAMAGLTVCGATLPFSVDPSLGVAGTTALIAYGTYKTDDIEVWPPRKPFTPGVETLNGRVAMLGVLAYALYNFQV